MDEYEPGMTRAKLEPVLEELRAKLVPLVAEAAKKPHEIMPSRIVDNRKRRPLRSCYVYMPSGVVHGGAVRAHALAFHRFIQSVRIFKTIRLVP